MNGTRLHYEWVLRRKDNAQRLWAGTKLFQCPAYSEDGLRLELVRERWFVMNATCLSSVYVEAGPDGLGLEFKDSDGHPTGAKVAQRFHQEFQSAKAAGKLDWLDERGRRMQAEVQGPDGSKQVIVFPPNDHIGRVVQSSGAYYEQDLLTAIRDLGITGAYLDIGAHCGNHTVFFAMHCRADEVCAVEPSPGTYDLLRRTLKVNDIHAVAMHGGVHPSWRWVRSVEGSWQPPADDPTRTNTGMRQIEQGRPGDVPAWTLDELGLPFERVGLIKIDTEGLGAEVLASGSRLIERDQPIIVVEAATTPEQRAVARVLGRWNYLNAGRFCWTPTWLWRP